MLIVSSPLSTPQIYAFEADAEGTATLPALSFSENEDIRILSFDCGLAALQIDAGLQKEAGERPVPDAAHAYRLHDAGFESIPFASSEYTAVKLEGIDPSGCLAFDRYIEIKLPALNPVEAHVFDPYDSERLLVHFLGLSGDEGVAYTYLVDRTGYEPVDPPLSVRTGAVFHHGGDLITLIHNEGYVFRGPLRGELRELARFPPERVFNACVASVPSSTTTFFFSTDRPSFYRMNGEQLETLYELPPCVGQCDGSGAVATSTNTAWSVVNGEGFLFHIDGDNTTHQFLDSGGLNKPRSVGLDPVLGPIIGSDLGGIFAMRGGRWELLTPSLTRDLDLVQPVRGGILFKQLNAVINEFNFALGHNCEAINIASEILRMQMFGDDLAMLVRTQDNSLAVRFYQLPRNLNRCPVP